MFSLRAAFASTGSKIMIACRPPGWLCARRGGVLVSTVIARERIASGWYRSDTKRLPLAASPCAS